MQFCSNWYYLKVGNYSQPFSYISYKNFPSQPSMSSFLVSKSRLTFHLFLKIVKKHDQFGQCWMGYEPLTFGVERHHCSNYSSNCFNTYNKLYHLVLVILLLNYFPTFQSSVAEMFFWRFSINFLIVKAKVDADVDLFISILICVKEIKLKRSKTTTTTLTLTGFKINIFHFWKILNQGTVQHHATSFLKMGLSH